MRITGALIALLLTGCSVTTHYLATPEQLAQAAQVPPGEATTTALPVYRAVGPTRPPKPVFVRADALREAQPELTASGPPLLRSRRYSKMVAAGATLTTIGSVISVVGSLIFFTASGDLQLGGGIVALSAEPMMITGTVLWILGLMRPPQEVPAGRPDLRYLSPEPPPVAPPLPVTTPAPLPALTLRF